MSGCLIALTIMTQSMGSWEATSIQVARNRVTRVEEVNRSDGTARSRVFFEGAPRQGILVFETPLGVRAKKCK